jgi:crotonobetainyl-CoA:carnitine CoA-transferase CaiB-like acyl-CoA transferase
MLNIAVVSSQFPGNVYPKSRKEVANPFNNTYKSADDRWFLFCAPEYNKFFPRVMTLLGREDLIDNEDYNTVEAVNGRGKNREIIEILEQALVKFKLDDIMKLFKENDIPIEKGYTMDEVVDDEQVWANDVLRKFEYPSGKEVAIPTAPVRFNSIGDPELSTSKPLGHHTEEVLLELGYSKEQIAQMKDSQAVVLGH